MSLGAKSQKLTSAGLLFILHFVCSAAAAEAAIIPCGYAGAPVCTFQHLIGLLVNIYNLLLGIAAFLIMIMLVWSAIRLLTYSFDEKPEAALENAKMSVRNALWGLVLIACAYLIVNTLLALFGIDPNSPVGQILRSFGFTL